MNPEVVNPLLVNPQLVNQALLPIGLGLIMLAMGLSLNVHHFAKLLLFPKVVALGITLQLVLLPVLAWFWVALLGLSANVAAGLILVALAPGGATSNVISYLCRGDVALSVCLTTIVSLVVPFTIPWMVNLQFGWLGVTGAGFQLPMGLTIIQLMVVTVVPVLLGMRLAHKYPATVEHIQPWVQRIVGIGFVALVIMMALANHNALPEVLSKATLAALLMCCSAMVVAYIISRIAQLSSKQGVTITVEVGIQNAGTAMMVAATLMNQPHLAMLPLAYGIIMNLPALCLICYRRFC
jgi:BASS family bile acid:Na+ symporter